MGYLLALAIVVPIVGIVFLPLVSKASEKLRNTAALLLVLCAFICSVLMLPSALKNTPISVHIDLPLGLSIGFIADSLAVFMAMISSFVGAIIVIYSFTYIDTGHKNEYYIVVTLFLGAMMGLVYSANLIFLYIFWEISAICCWRLIGYYREKLFVAKANKAFLITAFGALVMLLGFLLVYKETGTFDIRAMKGIKLSNISVILILTGILSKSAILPLHTWLPDAGVAPAPVTSLLHAAVLVKIGVYAYARLFLASFTISEVWYTVVPVLAAISSLVAAAAAIRENDLKRIIAYSTVSQLGFIFLGLSTGSIIGAAGGLLYILMHSIAKSGLFLCAGIVEHNTHTKNINELGGLFKTMPVTAVSFLLCAFSVIGIPPFGGFFAKYMVIARAVSAGELWIAVVFIAGAIMTIIYLLRLFSKVFLGQSSAVIRQKIQGVAVHTEAREASVSMVVIVAALAALSLASGLFISFPSSYAHNIIMQTGAFLK